MRTKFTPEYVLEMLKEIKTLCDQNKFNSIQFSKVYSSYLTFGKILESKGIFLNKTGKPTWIGVEPNLIMAKAVLRIFLENKKQIAEKKKQIAENKKMDSISKEEYEIDSNKMPYIESLEKENSELKLKLRDLKENISDVIKISKKETEIKDKKISELEVIIVEAKNANTSLVNQLGTMQNQQFFDRGNLFSSNSYLNKRTDDLTQENVSLKNKLKNTEDLLDGLKNELHIKCDLLEEQKTNSIPIEDLSNFNKKIDELNNIIEEKDKDILNSEIKIKIVSKKLIEHEEALSDFHEKRKIRMQIITEKDKIISELNELVSSQKEEISKLKEPQIKENIEDDNLVKISSVKKKIRIFGIPVYSSETN